MNFVGKILDQKRTILTAAFLCVVSGIISWQNMPRDEDPTMPNYWGMIIAGFPGADATTVERLVLKPIEEKLSEIDGLESVVSSARSDAAVISIELSASVDAENTDDIWDEIRRSLAEVRAELPDEAMDPVLKDDTHDLESVVLAITGADDLTLLGASANKLKRELVKLPLVAKVKIVADPGEQITIKLDDAAVNRLGIDTTLLLNQLKTTNRLIPGGSVQIDNQDVNLISGAGFSDLNDLRQTPVMLSSGLSIPLSSFSKISRTHSQPVETRMWYNGEPTVGLGIVPKKGINLSSFENQIKLAIKKFEKKNAPLVVNTMVSQPIHVNRRISQLTDSLLLSIFLVASFLIVAMGFRLGIVVAMIIPLVTLSSLAVFYTVVDGGALHQVSIAAFVIALGMLVDNAIVVTEGIQSKLDLGMTPRDAAKETITELIWPLGASTGTTIAAFIPMLLAVGVVAEFTAAVPQVMIITLLVSFVFAITVTPVLAMVFFKERKDIGVERQASFLSKFSEILGNISVKNRKFVLFLVALLVAGSIYSSRFVSRQFFPNSDKPVLVTDVTLPEGTHLDVTSKVLEKLTDSLSKLPYVTKITGFAGRSVPHFYYNLPTFANSPHFGQLVIDVSNTSDLETLMKWLETEGQRIVPIADLLPRKIEQGPPVVAPIELRLYGDDLNALAAKTLEVREIIQSIPGTRDARHSLGTGTPIVDFSIHENTAIERGITRSDVAMAMLRETRGLPVGPFRSGVDSIPIIMRSGTSTESKISDLLSLNVATPGHKPVPLATFILPGFKWDTAAIEHRNFQRMTSVTAHLKKGVEYSDVTNVLSQKLKTVKLKNIRLEYGGAQEGSSEANNSMMAAMPFGLILLLSILLIEFRSYRRVGMIFITVPLAASGVVPGLLLADQPFGFMSLLGIFSLVGIVVNNAIILVDVIDRLRADGMDIEKAVKAAVGCRLRPILLTTVTTIAGLLPLALSNTTLWPPLAWALISGLTSSTALTLIVIPSLYLILCGKQLSNKELTGQKMECTTLS